MLADDTSVLKIKHNSLRQEVPKFWQGFLQHVDLARKDIKLLRRSLNILSMQFLHQSNFVYLAKGLTYSSRDLNVLDEALAQLNHQTGFVESIIEGNKLYGFSNKVNLPTNQLIIDLEVYLTLEGKQLSATTIVENKEEKKLPPVLHLNLFSPSLSVPQRVEIPLKYILQGLPVLEGSHMVYMHGIKLSDGSTHSYYGKTKRNWMKRFMEHVHLAMKGSHRKFPELFGNAIKARYDQLSGKLSDPCAAIYSGSYHIVCSAGLNGSEANDVERFLINKRGLAPSLGLNMV